MKKLIALAILSASITGCMYGYVDDANTDAAIPAATVTVISGSCSGVGCGSAPYTETTNTSGLYVFDAYGDINGAGNVKIILPASGQEAVTLRVSKPGYISRTIYHKPDYQTIEGSTQDYLITQASKVYLCPWFSPDSDGDSICNAAEAKYGTDPFNSDTDGDNISDAAELFGSNGVDLKYYGANPKRKNLFIEADYYPGLKPSQSAIDQVIQAFADAPVSNPDGSTGITLAIDLDDQVAAADVDNNLSPVWTDFDVIKNSYFPNRRAKLFHYALFANRHSGGTSSGKSRGIPAHDFVVSLGGWSTPGGTVAQQAGTLMHEFGHNLNLRHGGNQNQNRKLNYFSVMSYDYQMPGLHVGGVGGVLDYSRLRVNAVGSTFNEFSAMSGFAGTTSAQLAQYRVRTTSGLLSGNANANLDLNNNGVLQSSVPSTPASASQNDWDNLTFAGGGSGGTIGDNLLGLKAKQKMSAIFAQQVPASLVESCMTEDDL